MSDLALCRLAAASYDAAPSGVVIDWRDMRAVVTGNTVAIRGTMPDSLANWERDASVWPERSTRHPTLGLCDAGALEAAEGLLPLLPGGIEILTGHSLGGQVAVMLAALMVAPKLLVTWDAPKAGGIDLAAVLSPVEVRQYRFRGSIVTDWPLHLDLHVRTPLINMCDWTLDLVRAHSIGRAVMWMECREFSVL